MSMDPLAPLAHSRMPTSLSRSMAGGGLRTMFQITIPLDDMPPPFKDTAVNKSFDLLQSTAVCRDGGRVPTPERMQVLHLAAGLEKHRLRRQQQLLLDIAQRCKEQDITSLSSGLTRKCQLSSFEDKYQRDIREYSTNTILFKTWGNSIDIPGYNTEPALLRRHHDDPTSPRLERGNTFFPVRRIKKLPPKELYMSKPTPKLQMGYSKGLLIKEPYDVDKKKELINDRKINGPIQLGLYNTPKNDQLQPLILPSIKYVGVELDKIETYVKSKKMNINFGHEKNNCVAKAITDGLEAMGHESRLPGRIIIHSKRPDVGHADHEDSLGPLKADSTPRHGQMAPPPTVRSKAREEVTAVSMVPINDGKEANVPVIPTDQTPPVE